MLRGNYASTILLGLALLVGFGLVMLRVDSLVSDSNYAIEDVIATLPESDTSQCTTQIGNFVPSEDIIAHHVEGAIGGHNGEHVLISGFSHYFKRLITSPRVDRLPRGTFTWVPEHGQAPVNGSHMQAASYGNSVWVAGGFMGTNPGIASSLVWKFSLDTGEWSPGPNLPTPRASGGFVAHENALHYIGGLKEDNETVLGEHLSLDAINPQEWIPVASFPRARNHFQAVSLAGSIYAVGGMTGHHGKNSKDLPYLDVYNSKYRQWIPAADMPESRSHAEMATMVFKDRIIVAGGRSEKRNHNSLDSVIEYNPHTDTWQHIATLPVQLYSGFATIANDKFYVGGGGRIWKEPSLRTWVADIKLDCLVEGDRDVSIQSTILDGV